jgi:hypothetical protein
VVQEIVQRNSREQVRKASLNSHNRSWGNQEGEPKDGADKVGSNERVVVVGGGGGEPEGGRVVGAVGESDTYNAAVCGKCESVCGEEGGEKDRGEGEGWEE